MFGTPIQRFLARQFARPSGWAGRWLIAPILNRTGAAMNRHTFARLAPCRGECVLEVGFGGGDLIQSMLGSEAGEIIGVDISDAMVARARRRFRREISDGRLRLLTGSAVKLPIDSGTIDKACSINTIYFWPDPEKALAEFARVVRSGGHLALSFQTPEAVRNWPGHRDGFTAYESDDIAALMEQAGFGDIGRSSGSDPAVGEFICLIGERR